mgnify:FL=1
MQERIKPGLTVKKLTQNTETNRPARKYFRGSLRRFKNLLGLGAMLCVVILTPLEYYDVKQGNRVQRTLQYVERYGDGEYAKSALLLDAAIDNQYAALQQLLMDPKLTADELEIKYTRFILQMFEDTELRNAMSQLLRFHEELVQCVINELCDQ